MLFTILTTCRQAVAALPVVNDEIRGVTQRTRVGALLEPCGRQVRSCKRGPKKERIWRNIVGLPVDVVTGIPATEKR